MGLEWSKPRIVKNGTTLVTNADMPGENTQKNIWNLWKVQKEEIKKDGLGVSKDTKTGEWRLVYFHLINENSYEKTTSGKDFWVIELEKKVKKWQKKMNEISEVLVEEKKTSAISSKVEEEEPEIVDSGELDKLERMFNRKVKKQT